MTIFYLVRGILVAVLAALVAPPVHNAQLPTPVRPASSVVAVVGDSITAGYLIADPGRTYPQVLGDRLYGRDHYPLHVVSHAGQCLVATGCVYPTSLAQTWQSEVLDVAPSPTTIVVEIGTNDLDKGIADATIEAGYQALVSSAGARGIHHVIVGTIPPRTATQWPSWGAQRQALNAWIRLTFGADVADFDAALAGPDGYARPEAMNPDGLHPNIYGASDLAYCVPLGRI